MPSSDSGPWLKNGLTWWVWDETLGTYKPEVLDPLSLRYILAVDAPDHTKYDLWIQLDGSGKAQTINVYSGGAWKSIYDDSFLALEGQVNTVWQSTNQYPFRADSSADQTSSSASSTTTIVFGNEVFDPSSVFDGVSTFTAPAAGYYHFDVKARVEKNSGSPTAMTIQLQLVKNGIGLPNDIVEYDDASGTGARTYELSTNLLLAQGDHITAVVNINFTGYATWAIKGNNTFMSGFKLCVGGSF